MLKLLVISTLFALALSQQVDPCSQDPALLIPNEHLRKIYKDRVGGDVDADFKAICTAAVAELTVAFTDSSKLTTMIQGLAQSALGAQTTLDSLNTQLSTISATVQTNLDALLKNLVVVNGQTAAFQNLIQLYGDAKAAIALECTDLKSAIQNATFAVEEAAKDIIDAKIVENNVLLANSAKLTTIVAALALPGATLDAATKDSLIAIAKELAIARAKQALLAKIKTAIATFLANNQGAVEKCIAAVQTQQAALTLGVRATLDEVKQVVIEKAQEFKERVRNILAAAVGEVKDVVISGVSVDSVSQKVTAAVQVLSDSGLNNEKLKSALQAILAGISRADAQVTLTSSVKRGVSGTSTFSFTLSGASTIASLLPVAPADLTTAYSQYQTLLSSTEVKDKLAALVADATGKTPAELVQAQTDAAAALATALASLETAKQATAAKLSEVVAKVQAAKTAVNSVSSDVKAQVVAALALRKAILEKAKLEVAQKVEEIKAAVAQAKTSVASLVVQLKDVNTQIAAAAAGSDALAALTAQKESLMAQLTQKAIEIISQVKAAAAAAAKIQEALQKIAAEQAEIDAKIAEAARKIITSAKQIQDNVNQHAAELKAKIIQALEAVVPELDNVTEGVINTVSQGAVVSLKIVFDNSKISLELLKKYITAVIGAHLNSDNVQVNVVAGSTKRATQTTTFSSTVGSTDGSSSSSAPAAVSGALIGGIIGGVLLLIVIVVVIVFVMQRKSDDSDYNAMRA